MQHTKVLRESIVINAGPSRIWAVLTRPEYTRQYFYDYTIHSSWTKGSDIHWKSEREGEKYIIKRGKILDLIPGIFLDFYIGDEDNSGNSVIPTRYELQPAEDGFKLTVTQDLPVCPDQEFRYHQQNWRSMLQKIKWVAEFS